MIKTKVASKLSGSSQVRLDPSKCKSLNFQRVNFLTINRQLLRFTTLTAPPTFNVQHSRVFLDLGLAFSGLHPGILPLKAMVGWFCCGWVTDRGHRIYAH